MGTGYIRQDTGNLIDNGTTSDATVVDSEFDAIEDAFDSTTGHTHDGTSAEGGPVTVLGPAQEYTGDASAFWPKTDATYDLGTSSYHWRRAYLDAVDPSGAAFTFRTNIIQWQDPTTGIDSVLRSPGSIEISADYGDDSGTGDSEIRFLTDNTEWHKILSTGQWIVGSTQATGGGGVARFGFNGDDFTITPTDGAGAYQENKQLLFDYSAGFWTFETNIVIPTATPANASATGTTGQIAWDTNYFYVCVGTNTWKRAALSTW